jgi:endonuclease/exonuclease/phosphatase family metal-dependent hydrolase
MIEHSWRSANRFIAANWDDHERQSAISHLLKKQSRLITQELSSIEDITIWIGTFNLHGRRVDEQRNCLSELISEPTDVVIACFQETIDLTAGSVLFSTRGDEDRNRSIDMQLLNALETLTTDGYVQVSSESLVGMYVTVFVKSRLAVSIDTVKTRRFKAGFGGAAGNKGSVAVTFRLFKSIEIEVVNLHLDSGSDRAEERMEQLAFILENASCHNRSLLTAPLSHHHRHRSRVLFICGDFNFRCDGLPPGLAVELVSKGRVEKLRLFDPFITKGATEGNVLKAAGFREMPLTFNPTYKYDVSSGELTDKRTPSWCDRIFFRSHFSNNMNLDAMYYNAIQNSRFSDHKPVIGFFALRVTAESAPPEKPMDLSGTESVESMRSDFATAVLQTNAEPVDLLSGGSLPASTNPAPVEKPDKDEWVDLLL